MSKCFAPTCETYINRIAGYNAYIWDNNGNLLNDGISTYAYTPANRLSLFTGPQSTSSYKYNGLGDRLSQTVDSVTTNYTSDLTTGLTQVLDDGTHTYLYGNMRLTQQDTANTEYFQPDGLVSVRQLADTNGAVTLAQSYQPYGETLISAGSGISTYAFAGEARDSYITDGLACQEGGCLIYLRSRYYSPETGRFITKDVWPGDYTRPLSLNKWLYVHANPVNLIDPSGQDPYWCGELSEPERTLFYQDYLGVDPRDLTDWLYREMIYNATSPKVKQQRAWNNIAKGWAATGALACGVAWKSGQLVIGVAGGIVIVGGAVFHATALYEYSQLI